MYMCDIYYYYYMLPPPANLPYTYSPNRVQDGSLKVASPNRPGTGG